MAEISGSREWHRPLFFGQFFSRAADLQNFRPPSLPEPQHTESVRCFYFFSSAPNPLIASSFPLVALEIVSIGCLRFVEASLFFFFFFFGHL